MNSQSKQLTKELRQAGASPAEIAELVPLAVQLESLRPTKTAHTSWWHQLLKPALYIVPSAALGMALIVFSQAALPTSPLYAVQRLTDNVTVAVQPKYRAQVMMKRAQQVNQLVSAGADSKVVLATLASYTAEARAYKTQAHSSYAAFEFCKSNLQQAASKAPADLQQAITDSLRSLQNV